MDRINEQQANLFHSIQSSQGKEEKGREGKQGVDENENTTTSQANELIILIAFGCSTRFDSTRLDLAS